MKFSFKNKILLLFFFICLVVVFLVFATNKNRSEYKTTYERVKHTQQVLYLAEQLVTTSAYVETASRGFVLTGREEFLAPFNNAKNVALLRLDSLKQLTKDNPGQHIRHGILIELIKKKIALHNFVIKTRREVGFEAAKNIIAEGTGLRYMTAIDSKVREIQAEEYRLLKIREEANNRSNTVFNTTLILQIIAILLAIVLAGFLVIYYSKARKKAEASLIENQRLLEAIIDNTSSVIYVKDISGKFLHVNKSFEQLVRLDKIAIIGKTNFEVFPHHIAAVFTATDDKVISQKATVEVEEQVECKGEVRTYISIKSPLCKSEGEVYGMCCISTDITEMKKQLHLIEDLYDYAPCGYYSIDAEGKFVNANKTTLRWLGYRKEELIGMEITDILTSESLEKFKQKFGNFKKEGTLTNTELVYLTKEKSGINVLVNASAHYNDKGEFSYSRSTIFDVTERKRLEAELVKAKTELESVELFKLAAQATADAMWDFDISSGKFQWGEGFETLFGYKLSNLDPDIVSWINHIHPDDKDRVVNQLFEAINSKDQTRWSNEYRYIRVNGTYASILDKGLIVRDQNDKPCRMVGAMQDITEYKKNLEDLQQFSFITSHNFAAPLSNILGIIKLVDRSALGSINKELFEMLETSALKLKETVAHLTEVMVIRNKKVEFQKVEIYEVFDSAFSTFVSNLEITKPNIFLDFKVGVVQSNKYYLESIFQNLLSNSVKYKSKKRDLSITITTEKILNGRTLITYSDNGLGIDLKRHKSKLFGMYQRFHSTGEGKGLGLFLIKSQLTALGASIDVRSELEKGTTFSITL